MNSHDKDSTTQNNRRSQRTEKDTAQRHFGPLSVPEWGDLVGQRIAQAMKDGEFDNLPGKGKPQKLDKNPYAGDNHLAFDIMQNNDVVPAWINSRKEIQGRISALRANIRAQVERHRCTSSHTASDPESVMAKAMWANVVQEWEIEVAALNKQIDSINLAQPASATELLKVRLDEEVAKQRI